MQRYAAFIGSLCLGVFSIYFFAVAFDLPKPTGFVNDLANILSAQEKISLELLLVDFERQTSNEITVLTVSSFQGFDWLTFSGKVFDKWKIGKPGKNNGVLLLIGPREGLPFPERGEARINVQRGLEGALPDSIAGSIIRKNILPAFKEKRYGDGILAGVSGIMQAVKGEYSSEPEKPTANLWQFTNFFIVLGFFLITYVGSFLARSKSWWLGGVLGGVGGAIVGFILWTGIVIVISVGVLGGLGLLFDYIVSKNYQDRLKRGKPTDFWHSGGGFWGGGFGGGSSGGFGGFGGGGIWGGGGAGGRW